MIMASVFLPIPMIHAICSRVYVLWSTWNIVT